MADSSKDIQLRELKDMIHDLQKMIKTLQATVDAANKREEALTQERDNLKEEVDLLRKKLFGTSSEKRVLDIPGQLNFFNEAELEQDPAEYYGSNVPLFRRNGYRQSGTMIPGVRNRDTTFLLHASLLA